MKHCVVIGRGVVGLTTALELATHGLQVTIIGLPAEAPSGSSASLGMAMMKAQMVARQPLFALKMYGFQNLENWLQQVEQASQMKIARIRGVFEPFKNIEEYQQIRDRVFHGELTGLNPFILTNQTPHSCINCIGVFYYEQDWWVHTSMLLAALECAVKKQKNITVVDKLVKTCAWDVNDKPKLQCADALEISADEVIIACGANSKNLLETLGFSTKSLRVSWGQILLGRTEDRTSCAAVLGKKSFAMHNGEFWFGAANYKFEPSEQDLQAGYTQLKSLAQNIIPLRQNVETKYRSGNRLYAPDRSPLIGSLPISMSRRIFLNTAHYKNAISFAHPSAKIISSLILNKKTDIPFAEGFFPTRFSWK